MFKFHNPNPENILTFDCTVRAISVVTGRTWDEVFIGLSVLGFIEKRMPNDNLVWPLYLEDLGFYVTPLPDLCPECYTVAEFCRDYPRGKYLLATGTHVIGVVDGDWYDIWDSGNEVPISYWSIERRK